MGMVRPLASHGRRQQAGRGRACPGRSAGEKREERTGWDDAPAGQGEPGLEQDSRARLVGPLPETTQGEHTDYVAPATGSSKTGKRETAATWWTRDITTKTGRARAQYGTFTQSGAPLPSCRESAVNPPRYAWEETEPKSD